MKKTNNNLVKIFSLLIGLLFFVSGCAGPKENTPNRVGNSDYMVGTDGIIVNFIDTIFPKEVFEKEVFTIGFDISNKGAYDINEGEGIITVGIEDDYVELPDNENDWAKTRNTKRDDIKLNILSFNIKGKSDAYPKGEDDTVIINMKSKQLDPKQSSHESFIILNSCYRYSTVTTQTVCIDSDPHNLLKKPKSCVVNPITLSSQGSPVAITKIETRMAVFGEDSIKPEFTIYIQNKGIHLILMLI